MLCSENHEGCAFHKSALLQSISSKIRSCKHDTFARGQFAAVDAFIANLDIPYIDCNGVMSSLDSNFKACQSKYISLVSTIILLLSSYDKVRNVIIFDDNTTNSTSIIDAIDAARLPSNTGITCVVSCVNGSDTKYSINVTAIKHPILVEQTSLVNTVKQLMDTDHTLTWIRSSGCVDLATALQHKPTDMWVNDTGTAATSVSLTGVDGSRLIPLLFTLPTVHNVASVNFGASQPQVTLRTEDIGMYINTTVCQFLTARTKDKKCYFCSLMLAVHNHICPVVRKRDDTFDFEPSEFVVDILKE